MLETVLLIGLGVLALVVLRPTRPDAEMDARLRKMLGPRPSSLGERADAASRVYELRDRGEELPAIAATLNAEGYRTERGATFAPIQVWEILGERRRRNADRWEDLAEQRTRQVA